MRRSALGADHRADAPPHQGAWHYVGLGLSGAVLLVVIALALIVIVVPKAAGATPLTVLTSSMEPGLPPGTLVVVRPTHVDDLAIGDVVTYQIQPGEPAVVTHRIIALNASTGGDRSFTLQGDNNSAPDAEPVLAEQIQGSVWYAVPLVGYVSLAMNGENRSWIVPAASVLLFAYAGFMIAGGTMAALRRRHATAPAPLRIR